MILYSDTEPRTQFSGHRPNPNNAYMTHYNNFLYLTFLEKYSDTPVERYQARKELVICHRKMDYWYKQADLDTILPRITKAKQDWSQKLTEEQMTP